MQSRRDIFGFLAIISYLCTQIEIKMARNKKPLPLLEGVKIEAVAAEGKCLFHWNDLVVFVPFCVPGDVCDIQIRRKKHSFAEGEVVRFIELTTLEPGQGYIYQSASSSNRTFTFPTGAK